ncbi:hypothetical protein Z043_123508, partial [Scleropages formosus]
MRSSKTFFQAVFRLPCTDLMASERIMDLTQGDHPASDYAVDLRSLAEKSEWDQNALRTCFRQGLNPRLCKELVFRGETWTLNQYITAAVALYNQARDREARMQPVPDNHRPPSKGINSLHLSKGCLTTSDRQRRLQGQLCLYCGEPRHLWAKCPIRPDPPMSGTLRYNHLS